MSHFTSFLEDHKGIFVFLFSVFIAMILTGLVIFVELPFIIQQFFALISTVLILSGFVYFVIETIRSYWVRPELEVWEWFLILSTLFIIVFVFLMVIFEYKPIDITRILGEY